MPTYVYECASCGARAELFHGMSESPEAKCSACGGPMQRLIAAGSGVVVKGEGPGRSSCSRLSQGGATCCGRASPCERPHCET